MPSGSGIHVVLNPNAGRLARRPRLHAALAAAAREAEARLVETSSPADLDAAADAIAAGGTELVLLAGGDGSVSAGLTALARAFAGVPLPPLALVPTGTVCTIARNFGAHGDPIDWMRRVLRSARAGTGAVRERLTLHIRDDRGGDRLGVIFGACLAARFFDRYDAAPEPGLGAAARIALRLFTGALVGTSDARRVLDPTPCELAIDGRKLQGEAWSLVLASTVRDLGLHMLVTYRAGEDPRRFHVVASGLPARSLGLQVGRVLLGRPLVGEPRFDDLATSLRVRLEGGGHCVLDGNVFEAGEVEVDAGPVVRVVSPSPAH